MTEKELRSMRRVDLLEIIRDQELEIERLKGEIEEARHYAYGNADPRLIHEQRSEPRREERLEQRTTEGAVRTLGRSDGERADAHDIKRDQYKAEPAEKAIFNTEIIPILYKEDTRQGGPLAAGPSAGRADAYIEDDMDELEGQMRAWTQKEPESAGISLSRYAAKGQPDKRNNPNGG
ncbi:MAG: hypothetical protein FWF44_01295 [Defluviitaleaceae bacterium]|nr:hypothetical protein [Defluviitaleaceae bacterium]